MDLHKDLDLGLNLDLDLDMDMDLDMDLDLDLDLGPSKSMDICPLPGNMHCVQQPIHLLHYECCVVRSKLWQR